MNIRRVSIRLTEEDLLELLEKLQVKENIKKNNLVLEVKDTHF